MNPSFANHSAGPVEGSYVVTFRDQDGGAGLELLRNKAGIRDISYANDYRDQSQMLDVPMEGHGSMFDHLNMCVVGCPVSVVKQLESQISDSSILAIEPDHEVFGISAGIAPQPQVDSFLDTGTAAWGLIATKATGSKYTGAGIRVAILDTGLSVSHPDFAATKLVARHSFLSQTEHNAEDSSGHGTHCTGILAGPAQPKAAPTYGLAPGADYFVAQVLDEHNRGSARQILAGLNWAIRHKCHVVSMSVGSNIRNSTSMFEEAGRRALDAGTLVVAAAGNNADRDTEDFGFVVRPANSKFIMAVGAINRHRQLASFSARSSMVSGGEVDIVAPGVEVFSAWPGTEQYRALSGTSMATPFVSGIAALHAEASGASGRKLWNRLRETAVNLPLPTDDVGAGLVQAP